MGSSHYPQVKRSNLLGVPIDGFSMQNLEEVVRQMATGSDKNQIVLLDLWGLMRARRNDLFFRTLHEAALVLPTSKNIVKAAKFLKKEPLERVYPFDFIITLLGILEKFNQSLYILGSKNRNLNIIAGNMRTSFPKLRIVGRHTGYYKRDREQDIKTAIKKASPSLLLVGFGIKGKDTWIFENKKHLSPGIYLWDGFCLDIFSGKRKKISKRSWESGSYFLKDLIKRPWRVFRVFIYLYYFILLAIYRLKRK